ncbi:MAG TPA: hypothetical protein PLF31_02015 [Candidatus Paceibacterota bacterium]|nr:hypothetical protein [Candidatus Paceibacterota bacterium]
MNKEAWVDIFIDLLADDFELDPEEKVWFFGKCTEYMNREITIEQFSQWLIDELALDSEESMEVVRRIENEVMSQNTNIALPQKTQTPASNALPMLQKIITPQTTLQRQTVIEERVPVAPPPPIAQMPAMTSNPNAFQGPSKPRPTNTPIQPAQTQTIPAQPKKTYSSTADPYREPIE